MARCTNCNYKWKVKEILMLGFSKSGKKCPNCKEKQYISAESQRIFTLGWLSLLFIPLILFKVKLSNRNESMF